MKADYYTVNELAEHFNINPKTIYRRLWAKGTDSFLGMRLIKVEVGTKWGILSFCGGQMGDKA